MGAGASCQGASHFRTPAYDDGLEVLSSKLETDAASAQISHNSGVLRFLTAIHPCWVGTLQRVQLAA